MTITPVDSKPKPKSKAKAVPKKVRAGLHINPAVVASRMRRFGKLRVGKGADVCLAAVLECIKRDVIRECMIRALEDKALRIAPKHITDAMHGDPEMARCLVSGIVPKGRTYIPKTRVVWSDRKLEKKSIE